MSTPNIPNISPTITLSSDDVQNLLFSSIAMEELGLAHIINAEGEKIQFALGTLPGISGPTVTINDILAVNASARGMMDVISRQEMILDSKLRTTAGFRSMVGPTGPTGPPGGVFSVNGLSGEVALTSADGIVPVSDSIPSDLPLSTFIQPGVYSSNAVQGIPADSPLGPANPQIWTLYVSVSGTTVQQLYLSNPSIYYRVRQADGLWTSWEPVAEVGPTGATGPDVTGDTGQAGMTGQTGPAGLAGLTGPAGTPGEKGVTGVTGVTITVTGPAGPTGVIGEPGATGAAGATGMKGASLWPELSGEREDLPDRTANHQPDLLGLEVSQELPGKPELPGIRDQEDHEDLPDRRVRAPPDPLGLPELREPPAGPG